MAGSPPPTNFPAPTSAVSGGFSTPTASATICGVTLALPKFVLGFSLGLPFPFPPKLPSLNLHFKLTCNPNDPVDVSGGLSWGAGRASNAPPDPDDSEDDPTF
jgi:hypothetical protein